MRDKTYVQRKKNPHALWVQFLCPMSTILMPPWVQSLCLRETPLPPHKRTSMPIERQLYALCGVTLCFLRCNSIFSFSFILRAEILLFQRSINSALSNYYTTNHRNIQQSSEKQFVTFFNHIKNSFKQKKKISFKTRQETRLSTKSNRKITRGFLKLKKKELWS